MDPLFAQTEGHVRTVSEEIAAFISGEKDFHEIAHFFADGTATKKTLSNFVNEYYIHPDLLRAQPVADYELETGRR